MTTFPRPNERHATHESPWAWTRSFAFATASLAIGGAQHVISGEGLSPLTILALALLWTMLTAYAHVFASERLTKRVTMPALVVGQLAVHVLLVMSTPAASHHHGMSEAAHAAAHHSAFAMPSMSMIAIHLVATFIGAALLKRLDQLAWRTVRAVVRAAVVALYEFIASLGAPRVTNARRVVRTVSQRTPAQHWVTRALGLRGPPRAIAHS